jgi:CelD/BcsL family acetyltransferase involved in cellulose biosynthesis
MVTIEKITTREGFERLASEWNPLLEDSASNTITLTFEWLTTWWDVFGVDRELYILVAWAAGQVIGIAPLLRRTVQRYGLLPYRRLEFLASGEDEADEICSEYLDFILRRGREAEALGAICDYLHKNHSDWDEMLLTDVSGESENLKPLESLCAERDTKWEVVREQVCIYLPLAGSWESFLDGLNRNLRTKIRRDRRVLESNRGGLRIIDSPAEFEESFDMFIRLHQARWTARGKPGVFASEKFTRFHRTVAPKLLAKGWLKLYMVERSGEPFAALYLLTYAGKMHEYQSGFIQGDADQTDTGLIVRSPGTLVQGFGIEKAIEAGMREYDLLKGDAGSYKFIWGCETRSIIQVRLAQVDSKEAIYSTTTKFVDRLRNIKRALRRYAAI